MEKKVCVFLADGFEEIEGLTVVDLLRRAGIFVTTVSITGKLQIRGSHDICVQADKLFEKWIMRSRTWLCCRAECLERFIWKNTKA